MVNLDEIRLAKGRHAGELLKKANVVGVAIGYKEKGGQRTEIPSLVIMVRKKLPVSELRRQDVVPSEIDRIGTDVKAVGEIRALQNPTSRKSNPRSVIILNKI